jgi:hypothetical protein
VLKFAPRFLVVLALLVCTVVLAGYQIVSAQTPCAATVLITPPQQPSPNGVPSPAIAQVSLPCAGAVSASVQVGNTNINSQIAAAQAQLKSFQDRMRAMNIAMGVPTAILDQMDAQMQAMNEAIAANAAAANGSTIFFVPRVSFVTHGGIVTHLIFQFGSCTTVITLRDSANKLTFIVQTACASAF